MDQGTIPRWRPARQRGQEIIGQDNSRPVSLAERLSSQVDAGNHGSGPGTGAAPVPNRGRGSEHIFNSRRHFDASKGEQRPTKHIKLPKGVVLANIDAKDIEFEEGSVELQDFRIIASYNWLNRKAPTILVPGGPARWAPPAVDYKLEPDRGFHFINQNASRYPKYPLEPMFRALQKMNVSSAAIDCQIVACRNTMTKLFQLVEGTQNFKPFEIFVERIGEKTVFCRHETRNDGIINEKIYKAYGYRFPEEYTSYEEQVKGSTAHQRVSRFSFCGVDYLLLFDVDSYHADMNSALNDVAPVGCGETDEEAKALETKEDEAIEFEDLADGLVSLLDENRPKFELIEPSTSPFHTLTVENGGLNVSQNAVLEIKTRAMHSSIDLPILYPRLWFAQTKNFMLNRQVDGVFIIKERRDLTEDLLKWEKDNHENLLKLGALIQTIVETVKRSTSLKCRLSGNDDGNLRIMEIGGSGQPHKSLLPEDLCGLLRGE